MCPKLRPLVGDPYRFDRAQQSYFSPGGTKGHSPAIDGWGLIFMVDPVPEGRHLKRTEEKVSSLWD